MADRAVRQFYADEDVGGASLRAPGDAERFKQGNIEGADGDGADRGGGVHPRSGNGGSTDGNASVHRRRRPLDQL